MIDFYVKAPQRTHIEALLVGMGLGSMIPSEADPKVLIFHSVRGASVDFIDQLVSLPGKYAAEGVELEAPVLSGLHANVRLVGAPAAQWPKASIEAHFNSTPVMDVIDARVKAAYPAARTKLRRSRAGPVTLLGVQDYTPDENGDLQAVFDGPPFRVWL